MPRTASDTVAYGAFVPHGLPPVLALDGLYPLLDRANHALGGLNALGTLLPDTSLFIYTYVRKEAVLSSQIEGTQSSLSDLLLHESHKAPGVPTHDAAEVSNYIRALQYGLAQLKTIPLSLRLIRGVHKKLMHRVRGNAAQPGELRTSQNWIGGARPSEARFVPPPPDKLNGCLDAFEKFLHDDGVSLPVLIKAALAHAQFETIHPFLDGNGRVGRMLITLILCAEGVLDKPHLYLSLYLKKHREDYYEHLQRTRVVGDWHAWVRFFLQGVVDTAQQAVTAAIKTNRLFDTHQNIIAQHSSGSILRVYRPFQKHVITDTTTIAKACREISYPTVLRSLQVLEGLGIIKSMPGHRPKTFVYKKYLDILNEDIRGT